MQDLERERIFEIIRKDLPDINFSDIDPDAPMRDKVNLDSMQLVGIMARLENELEIEIPITALEAETLNQFLSVVSNEFARKHGG